MGVLPLCVLLCITFMSSGTRVAVVNHNYYTCDEINKQPSIVNHRDKADPVLP